jgi:hypothetical protein
MRGKGGIITGIISLVIGGTIYTVSQADIVKNFSKDTGMSQTEAEQYVESVTEDDLIPYDELGSDFISEGQDILSVASEIDCVNYIYEWETTALSCEEGKSQLRKVGNSEIALGKAYTVLASESASTEDISSTIRLIDKLNSDLSLEIVRIMLDYQTINEIRKTNSFNKDMLQSQIDSS